MLAPISNIAKRIVLDRNLGALGKELPQLIATLKILTKQKVDTPQTKSDELGIQLADFIAGASRYLKTNFGAFLSKNTIIFRYQPE